MMITMNIPRFDREKEISINVTPTLFECAISTYLKKIYDWYNTFLVCILTEI